MFNPLFNSFDVDTSLPTTENHYDICGKWDIDFA